MARTLERERVGRRLMAILAADVVGYSRLIAADDEGTLAQLKARHDDLVAPKIKEYRGRIVRTTGDGLLVLFVSAVDSLRCAIEIQRKMAALNASLPLTQRIEFRMGISVGDIIVEGRDVHGDGVNVAARLEALAEPGGICVSERVREDAQEKFDVAFEDAGKRRLKNIAHPVRIYHVRLNGTGINAAPAGTDRKDSAILPVESRHSQQQRGHFHAKVYTGPPWRGPYLRIFLTYSITPFVILLILHYIVVMKLDANTMFLRTFSLLIPFFAGVLLCWQTGAGLSAALLLGTATAIMSVGGMLAVVGLLDSTPVIPSSPFEWQEAFEYAIGILLAMMLGNAVTRAVNAALAAPH